MKFKIGTVLTIIAMLFGAWLYIDNDKADAGEFKALKQQVEYDKTERRWYSIRKRIWSLEDRYTYEKARLLSEYQELILEREKLELKMKGE